MKSLEIIRWNCACGCGSTHFYLSHNSCDPVTSCTCAVQFLLPKAGSFLWNLWNQVSLCCVGGHLIKADKKGYFCNDLHCLRDIKCPNGCSYHAVWKRVQVPKIIHDRGYLKSLQTSGMQVSILKQDYDAKGGEGVRAMTLILAWALNNPSALSRIVYHIAGSFRFLIICLVTV